MSQASQRRQQTLARCCSVSGFGLFNGCDVIVEFCPADCDHGIVFERTDLADPVRIPALIEYVTPQNRCTVIANQGTSVSVIEHVMAALAGMHVDNCLVRINAPEPPGCDGSSIAFVEALLRAGIVRQEKLRACVKIRESLTYQESPRVGIAAQSAKSEEYQIGFLLDYGTGPIPFQALNINVSPSSFLEQLSNCRTFVLQSEVDMMRSAGLGRRATPENVLVFTDSGVLDNTLRWPDECVRHKILDCVGDFALLGCDIQGQFTASRSGHRLNHEMIRLIRQSREYTDCLTGASAQIDEQSPLVSASRFSPSNVPVTLPGNPSSTAHSPHFNLHRAPGSTPISTSRG